MESDFIKYIKNICFFNVEVIFRHYTLIRFKFHVKVTDKTKLGKIKVPLLYVSVDSG